jgi:hypothetical protein
MFRAQFIPRVREFAGSLDNPWDLTDLAVAFQKIWDEVFISIPHIIEINDPVYDLVSSSQFCSP